MEMDEKLQEVFRKVFSDNTIEINDDMDADDVESWDSMTHINMIIEVETCFGIKFRNAEIARLQCVGDLKRIIEKKL